LNIGVAIGNLGFAMKEPLEPAAHADLCCEVALKAERCGFHSVWVGDHLTLPQSPSTPYPYGEGGFLNPDCALLDPFAIQAAVARITERVGLGFGVVVLPYRGPVVTAKLIATIDALSRGRVILGIGAGWLPEEFQALGVDFDTRARQTDEGLRYLLEVFETGKADGMTVLPRSVQQPHPPVWVGGMGAMAMRRAVELADGWDAPYATPDRLAPAVERLRNLCVEGGRDPSTLGVAVRGIGADRVDDDLIATYASLGVTDLGVILPLGNPRQALTQLEELADRCGDRGLSSG
jgi:probable F420-dependent oxidoreductase